MLLLLRRKCREQRFTFGLSGLAVESRHTRQEGALLWIKSLQSRRHDDIAPCQVVIGFIHRHAHVVQHGACAGNLAQAREIFLTGTAAEVTPVGEIDDLRFTPGEVTRLLTHDYQVATGQRQAAASAA